MPVLDVRFLCVCVRACVCVRVCIYLHYGFFHSARSHVPRPRAYMFTQADESISDVIGRRLDRWRCRHYFCVPPAPPLPPMPPPLLNANRTAVCMWYDEAASSYGALAGEVNRQYAARQQYVFINIFNRTYFDDRAPAWQRIGMLLEVFESDMYETLIWVDADSVLLPENADVLPRYLQRFKYKHWILSADRTGQRELNSGILIMRNTPSVRSILTRLAYIGHHTRFKKLRAQNGSRVAQVELRCESLLFTPNWEQACLQLLHEANADQMRHNAVVLPYGRLQTAAVPKHCVKGGAATLHFMGTNTTQRVLALEAVRSHLYEDVSIEQRLSRMPFLPGRPGGPPYEGPSYALHSHPCGGDRADAQE